MGTPKREQLIKRITKMLAIYDDEGAPDSERHQALSLARKLMDKYAIEELELTKDAERPEQQIVSRTHPYNPYYGGAKWRLANTLDKLFDVRAFGYGKGKVIVYGTERNIDMFVPVFDRVVKDMMTQLGRAVSDSKLRGGFPHTPGNVKVWKNDFLRGYRVGVRNRVSRILDMRKVELELELDTQTYALVVTDPAKQVEAFIEQNVQTVSRGFRPARRRDAFEEGVQSGKEAQLLPEIGEEQ